MLCSAEQKTPCFIKANHKLQTCGSEVTGPMMETSGSNIGQIYRGNQQQYEFIEYLGENNWKNYLKCANNNGIILK